MWDPPWEGGSPVSWRSAGPSGSPAWFLIAPAVDFTEALIEPQLSLEALAALKHDGVWRQTSQYDPHGYEITVNFLEEGRRWSLLPGPIAIAQPIHILQGGQDMHVPWRHVLEVVEALESRDVILTLVKDGDHRLSRPQDLVRLIAAVRSAEHIGSPRGAIAAL